MLRTWYSVGHVDYRCVGALVLKLGRVWGDVDGLSRGQLSGGYEYIGMRRRQKRTREGDQKCLERAKVSQGYDYQMFAFSVVIMC